MAHEITSKNIEGITDLVVIAPIKDGFIHAYENITYATRLRIVAEALHRIRVSAREHESTVPFSDTTERILTLLDFRVGVLDQDLFKLNASGGSGTPATHELKSTRFLYLTATFDGAWEPYMRLIWKPLGSFLDLLFCNCEGYVTAGDHGFAEYAQWVRDHQMDSAIFYSTTGLTVKDALYLNRLDRLQREPGATELDIARMTMPNPESAAKDIRDAAMADLSKPKPAIEGMFKIHELALEALTVLFRIADFYPPEWLTGDGGGTLAEGKYLARVACELLKGWQDGLLLPGTVAAYAEPLEWYRTAKALFGQDIPAPGDAASDPELDASQVQAGLLTSVGSKDRPVRQGALLLMTIKRGADARSFIDGETFHFHSGGGSTAEGGFFRTIAFTAEGLERMGLDRKVVRQFPKEFREGMAIRSGLLGDMRENHPRRWQLPERNWPPMTAGEPPRPPVEMSEVDFVIQLRYAPESADGDHDKALQQEIERIANAAEASGVALAAVETMENVYNPDTRTSDHFGFRDGMSQPDVLTAPAAKSGPNQVRLGELLCGYSNDRGDIGNAFAAKPDDADPRWENKRKAATMQKDGTYLVIRKLEQHDKVFEDFLTREAARIRNEYSIEMTEDELAARLVGRDRKGVPLVQPAGADENTFSYLNDTQGSQCPFSAHIRRTNPRSAFQGRPTPRIVRRGMAFGKPRGLETDPKGKRGLMFMCYNASIAEQFETIQRWINGGNSTDVSSGQNDPLLGVGPKTGDRLFRFEKYGKVIRVAMPAAFVSLHWGLYLFVPSKRSLSDLCSLHQERDDFDDPLENSGAARIDLIEELPENQKRAEWKRLIEDFDAKDPGEKSESPHVWSAIRWYKGGSYRIQSGAAHYKNITFGGSPADGPLRSSLRDTAEMPVPIVLSASKKHIMQVLSDWKTYSVEEQLVRFENASGAIYVAQQPQDHYYDPAIKGKYDYKAESAATNAVLMAYDTNTGFADGLAAGRTVLAAAAQRATELGLPYFKLEMRRQFVTPVMGLVCTKWFGLPDWDPYHHPPATMANAIMLNGGWNWHAAVERQTRCPGDCMAPSRYAFYPRPGPTIEMFGKDHGLAIRKAGADFVDRHVSAGTVPEASITGAMFNLLEVGGIADKDVLARNLIGIMLGAIPPMEGSLRGILIEWLNEKTLWRLQAAYKREILDGKSEHDAANAALYIAMTRAMCKRPAPDVIYRTATSDGILKSNGFRNPPDIDVKSGDQVILNLVSAAQWSLYNNPDKAGDVSIIFGGNRKDASQEEVDHDYPVHACPAQQLAIGAMLGVLAAFLEFGRIQALPAGLIVKISGWKPLPPPPPAPPPG